VVPTTRTGGDAELRGRKPRQRDRAEAASNFHDDAAKARRWGIFGNRVGLHFLALLGFGERACRVVLCRMRLHCDLV
jgi:hypothetical protein